MIKFTKLKYRSVFMLLFSMHYNRKKQFIHTIPVIHTLFFFLYNFKYPENGVFINKNSNSLLPYTPPFVC